MPPFDLQGGAFLALARAVSVSFQLSVFGTVAFRVLVAPKAFARMPTPLAARLGRDLLLLAQLSLAAAVLGTLLWLVIQAAYMGDAESVAAAFGAVPAVLEKTSFGHTVALQLAAFLALAAMLGWRDNPARQRAGLVLATLALALQAGHSHAFSMNGGPSFLLACDILHLLGAGAWLGGLIPLLLVVALAPPQAGAAAARWFSPLGQCCLVALVVSAAVQGWVLVDSIPGLIGTGYGWIVLLKLALFGVLFVFAWLNRYDLAPALLGQAPERARRVLVASIAWQTGFAIAIVAAAVVLSELPPAMHIQALWPFSQRFSLDAVREDPDFKREVIGACLALAGGAVLVATALVVRRLRLAALAGAAAIAWFALPHLDLLFVTAYPTSFYHSPTGFTAATIVDGRASFAQNCVSCHGAGGAGDGPAAKGLAVPPADLTAGHLWMHSDGELFWWIGHGMVSPEGAQVMPGFAATLDEDARWAVIDYIRAHNAGNARKMNGGWTHPIKAPDFAAQCASGGTQLADLRGKFVRLVIGVVPPHAEGDVVTIVAAPPAGGHAADCVAGDETVAQAYAVVCGLPVDKLSGTQFLIDEDGWLRAVQAPGATPGWDDPKTLADTVRALRAQKVQAPQDESMHMKMPM